MAGYKCPHCLNAFFPAWEELNFFRQNDPDLKKYWSIKHCECPSCRRTIIQIGNRPHPSGITTNFQLVHPKGVSRAPLDPDIPKEFSDDYSEACNVLAESPKASAALSRRCLQSLLKEKAKTKQRDLNDQIQEVLDSGMLPSFLADGLDAIRVIGNFAAHTTKSKSTGEIVDVEPGEAEWNLDVIEGLFDFYFVQPKLLKQKRDRLNAKLQDAGKPPLR